MFGRVQRIALVVLIALAATALLHAHVGPESSVHCNLCLQQSHAVVVDAAPIEEQSRCEWPVSSLEVSAVGAFVQTPSSPRAPPV